MRSIAMVVDSGGGNQDAKPKRSSLLRAKLPKLSIPKLSFKRSKNPGSSSASNSKAQSRCEGADELPYAARRMNFRSIDFRRGSFSRGGLQGSSVEPRASRSSTSRPATAATASSSRLVGPDNNRRDVSPGSPGSFSLPPIPPIPLSMQRTYSGRRSLFPIDGVSAVGIDQSHHPWSPATPRLEPRMPTSTSTNATSDLRSAGSSVAHNYGSIDTNITTPSSGRPSKVSFVLRPGIIPSSSTESYSSLLSHFPILSRRSNSKIEDRSKTASTPSSILADGPLLSHVPSAPARMQLGEMCSKGLAEAQAAIFSRREQRKSRLLSRDTAATPVSILRRRSYTVNSQPRHAYSSPAAIPTGVNRAANAVSSQDFAFPQRNHSVASHGTWSPANQAFCYSTAGSPSDLAYEHANFDVYPLVQQNATNERLHYAMGNFTWDEAFRHRQTATTRESVIGPRSEAPTGLEAVAEDGPFVFGSKRSESAHTDPEEAVDEYEGANWPLVQSITKAAPQQVNIARKNDGHAVRAFDATTQGPSDSLPTTTCPSLAHEYEPLPHPRNYVDDSSSEYETATGEFSDSSSTSSSSSWHSAARSHFTETESDEAEELFQHIRHSQHVRAAAFEKLVTSRPGASSKGAAGTYNGARLEIFRSEAMSGSSRYASCGSGEWRRMNVKGWREWRGMDGGESSRTL